MRKKLTLLILTFFPLMGLSQIKADDILGVWLTEVKDAKIEIYLKNRKYYGKVVWIKVPNDKNGQPIKDSNNPDATKKNQTILGMDILTGFFFKSNEWIDGNIYDPKNGEIYTCKLWLENGNLKVRGYVGWFYDTKTWTQVN
ncbi:MAG: DUF2147 domain-containing protein [Crocinitomicaceae bacterium]